MNKLLSADKESLFKYEVLRSRLAIRDFFLQNITKEVYENVGQVLSVVKMQLALSHPGNNTQADESIESAEQLIGQSIRDLRAMCKSFYPDADIAKEELTAAFENSIKILYQNTNAAVEIKGVRKDMQPELKLVVFKMIQEILIAIKKASEEFLSLVISYTKKGVNFIVNYTGKAIALNEEIKSNAADTDLTLQQRAELIEGTFNISKSKTGITAVKLTSPLKLSFYE